MKAQTKRRLDEMHSAEVERWREEWLDFWAGAEARLPSCAAGIPEARQRFTDAELDAADAVWESVRASAAAQNALAEAWAAWWEGVAWLWALDYEAPDLSRWPSALPPPPEEPAGDWEDAEHEANVPHGSAFTTPEGVAAAWALYCLAVAREARSLTLNRAAA